MVIAVRSGSVIVTATSEGKSATFTLNVTEPVATVLASLMDPTIAVGERSVLTVFLRDANNVAVSRRPITYASSNPAVATITDMGLITAMALDEVFP